MTPFTSVVMHPFFLILLFSCVSQGHEIIENKQTLAKRIQIHDIKNKADNSDDKVKPKYVSGEILVKFKNGTTEKTIHFIQRELNLKTIRMIKKPYLYLMKILNSASVKKTIASLQKLKEVEYAEPNFITTIP